MVARRKKDPPAKDKAPAIALGLIELVRVLARHAACELVASTQVSPLREEHADD